MQLPYNILVVDDDLKNIQVGINFLKKNENYHLVFATSGEQALQRVKEKDFDLILLDIIMPTMDGFEVCKKLKEDEKTKTIPIIFLTAKHEEESLMRGFEIGGADYITKPFKAAELNARVKTHLELNYYYRNEIAKLQKLLMYSQKAETIKFIASGVAHDCKNFLTAIPYNLLMLEEKIQTDPTQSDECLDLIEDSKVSVNKIAGLLEQFFSFSKDDENVCETVDMNEVVSDLSKIYKDWVRHSIHFTIDLLSQPALTYADKMHVEQVLLNLLINAQHAVIEKNLLHSGPGQIRLVIDKLETVNHDDLGSDGPHLAISVIDNGIGMNDETMDKIFDPYFTTRRNSGGSGLGLAVSLHIIKMHKGAIHVQSSEGEGTTFTLYLPSMEEDS